MVVDKGNTPAYDWGNGAKAWTLVNGSELSVKEEWMPADAEESFHLHQKAQQFFYILQGEACMLVNETTFFMRASQGISIPAGTPHKIINRTLEALRFLVISQPAIVNDRIELT